MKPSYWLIVDLHAQNFVITATALQDPLAICAMQKQKKKQKVDPALELGQLLMMV
jgi:hypothetical protein